MNKEQKETAKKLYKSFNERDKQLESILKERGIVKVECDKCGKETYEIEKIDSWKLCQKCFKDYLLEEKIKRDTEGW